MLFEYLGGICVVLGWYLCGILVLFVYLVSSYLRLKKQLLIEAFQVICTARAMSTLFEQEKAMTSKYVHATSKGHEAIQIALGLQLKPQDWVAPYYRDDALLLSIGMQPYELMLQLMAKKDDPFSGGRTYYSHPSLKKDGFPKIPHQSSATGMQAIPTTGVAMGIQYKEKENNLTFAYANIIFKDN